MQHVAQHSATAERHRRLAQHMARHFGTVYVMLRLKLNLCRNSVGLRTRK